ncbi:MAG: hypothetical protein ACLQK8_31000 [Streptosporangiaceae bacterium]|jgi:L-ascorbate metabolism protein UlaG (beta-lactamase superfamily)
MPLDAAMPDAGALVRAIDIRVPSAPGAARVPVTVADDAAVLVTAVAVTHGRAAPALAYRFDTADGSVVFSGDTTVSDDLIALARAPTSSSIMSPTWGTWSGAASPARPRHASAAVAPAVTAAIAAAWL